VTTNTLLESDAERKEHAVADHKNDGGRARMPGHEGEVPGQEYHHRCRENQEVPPGQQKPATTRGWGGR
jgi:hypothetical protein